MEDQAGLADQQAPVEQVEVNRRSLFHDVSYWQRLSALIVVGMCTGFLLLTLHPELILRNNTPTGGDLGAHVWGPAYLRDHLLPSWRLTGWSMDWYSGLPVYRFYMVVPALLVLLFDVLLPYGISLKLVAVVGILALPWCAWRFGRLARFAFPLPEMFAIAATIFLYDESFTIYGGNIASTMAGEFSFSISLALAFLAFAAVARGQETNRGVVVAAVLLALSALSHGIVLMFAFGGVLLLVLFSQRRRAAWFGVKTILVAILLSAFWVVPFLFNHAFMTDMKYEPRPSGANDSFWSMFFPLNDTLDALFLVGAVIGFVEMLRTRHRVGIWMGVYAVLLAAGVFIARESLPVIGLLWNPRILPFLYILRYFLFAIGVHATASFVVRAFTAERRLRELVAVPREDELLQASQPPVAQPPVAQRVVAERVGFSLTVLVVFGLVTLVALGFRFQELPGARFVSDESGQSYYAWGPLRTKASNDGFVDGWARWNFSGYEGKPAYGEYHGIVQTMQRLGDDPRHGCGRALWENNSELNKYGTTMSLMLLPFWTDGCIGSSEGLFFEASGTTAYHFIAAAAMSKQSSNPVRELRYDNNDARRGVRYLQELGIRYYLGFTPEAVASARAAEGLTEVATSGPWVVFEVAESDVVVPLARRPIVVSLAGGDPRERWLELGTSWFQNPTEWSALPASDGPASWQRTGVEVDTERRTGEPGSRGRDVDVVVPTDQVDVVDLEPVEVSGVVVGEQSVRFSVDRVRVPVLVRVSYFPNWAVDGAEGPFRVAPNMMVVVPTDRDVRLHFALSLWDKLAYVLTVLGIVVLVFAARRERKTAG
ncbi:MAG: 6-pyruvoyl-tetrahydropterin synthase-related protein [Ilumatobacteraceae bacterium]